MKSHELFEQDEDWSVIAEHDDGEQDYITGGLPSEGAAYEYAIASAKTHFEEFYTDEQYGQEYSLEGNRIISKSRAKHHNTYVVTEYTVIPTADVEVYSRMGVSPEQARNIRRRSIGKKRQQ